MGFIGGSGEILDGSVTIQKLASNVFTLTHKLIQQNALNTLMNSVASSSTLNDYDEMFVDVFSDADGASNTIDTGNTTAIFNTNKYSNLTVGSSTDEAHGYSEGSTHSGADDYFGAGIEPNQNLKLIDVTKETNCTATTCFVYDTSDNLLGSATFSGNTATFSEYILLSSGVRYYIVAGISGSTHTRRYGGGTYPKNMTNMNYVAQCYYDVQTDQIVESGSDYSNLTSIKTATASIANKIVQTNMQTIDANPTAHQVYSKNTTAGSGSVTYDISFDNGSTWVTGQAINTKNTSVHAGSQMILKLNLNGTGAGNTSEAENYGVMLFY